VVHLKSEKCPDLVVSTGCILNTTAMKKIKSAMTTTIFAAMLVAITLVAGCASSGPVIDPAGVDMQQYETDVAECEAISDQVDQKAGTSAVGGAIIGGLIGAVTGNSGSVQRGAGAGAVIGGAKGAGSTSQERDKVVKNCLRNRGYKILN
jgi:outer membrane lipoprotein SlyB